MKPKITCRSCSADLEWGAAACPSCGTAVEWPRSGKEKTKDRGADKPKDRGIPLRNIVAVVVFIGLGVVVLEYFTGTSNVPSAVPGTTQQGGAVNESGADMSVLPHVEELEAKLKSDPSNQDLRRELGNHLMDARFFHRAIGVYRDFLERDPKDPDILVDLGICYKELGDLETAEAEMKKALTYAPRHLHAHFNLGIVSLVKGDLAASTEWFKKTAELDPNGQLGQRAKQLIEQHLSVNTQ